MFAPTFKLLVLFASLGSRLCFEQTLQAYERAKVGERCERDRNCIQHAYCHFHMTCLCDQYYSPTLDKSMCIASAGLSCADHSTCASMNNAICRQGVCGCKDSYMLDINNSSNCISRPLRENDRCQRTDDCQDVLGRAFCIDGRCQCITSYHFANETGKCIQTRFLYNACTTDYQCIDFDNRNVLVCRNGECVCKDGEAACGKASMLSASTLAYVLLAVLQFAHRLA